MTDSNYTHVTLVADRSASMGFVRSDAEGAINTFIEDQKKVDGKATLLLVDFDAPNGLRQGAHLGAQWHQGWTGAKENDWYRQVFKGDLKDAPRYVLTPRGNTALNDAVGKAIRETGEFLSAMSENERPGKVIFVVQTDGEENSSIEYTVAAVKALVDEHQNKYSWEFVFLGMGLGVEQQGLSYGFQHVASAVANNGATQTKMYHNLSRTMTAFRGGETTTMAAAAVALDESGDVK